MQTLHPNKFDQGSILAQTPYPGFVHHSSTVPELLMVTASEGAKLLLHCIKARLFVPPTAHFATAQDDQKPATARPAPKIRTEDRFVDFNSCTAHDILRRHRVIGPLWSYSEKSANNKSRQRRIIWSTGFELIGDGPKLNYPPGQPYTVGLNSLSQATYIQTCDDQVLKIDRIKIDGGEEDEPLRAATRANILNFSTASVR